MPRYAVDQRFVASRPLETAPLSHPTGFSQGCYRALGTTATTTSSSRLLHKPRCPDVQLCWVRRRRCDRGANVLGEPLWVHWRHCRRRDGARDRTRYRPLLRADMVTWSTKSVSMFSVSRVYTDDHLTLMIRVARTQRAASSPGGLHVCSRLTSRSLWHRAGSQASAARCPRRVIHAWIGPCLDMSHV